MSYLDILTMGQQLSLTLIIAVLSIATALALRSHMEVGAEENKVNKHMKWLERNQKSENRKLWKH